jgi:uncharacterized protein YgbK (DUF1537 family)
MNEFFLADDLSGALDAAAAFHHGGRRVRIVLRPEAWDQVPPDETAALTTETRNAPPERAAAVVRSIMLAAQGREARLLYKKIDSTLRGAVAAEVAAVLECLPTVQVLFAPANPAVGRTVREGVLRVNGVPVAETPFGRDPACPLRTSAVREILGEAATDRVEIPDTVTQDDLVAAVRQMSESEHEWIAVGSGALAKAVAPLLPRPLQLSADPEHDVPRSPVLMIGGSAHPLNRTQAQRLAAASGVVLHELAFESPAAAGQAAGETLRARGVAALQAPAVRTTAAAALGAIVEAAAVAIERAGVRRIFATGGETAYALCERLGIETLLYLDEIEPGHALAAGQSRNGPVLLAVKPGGFGDEHSWGRALERLKRKR